MIIQTLLRLGVKKINYLFCTRFNCLYVNNEYRWSLSSMYKFKGLYLESYYYTDSADEHIMDGSFDKT